MPIKKRNIYLPRNERLRLSKANVDRMAAGSTDYLVKDSEVPQLHLKVTPAGNKSFLVRYRNEAGQERKHKIGNYPSTNVTKARIRAAEVMQTVTLGQDPAATRATLRKSPTLAEYGEAFLRDYASIHLKARTVYGYERTLRGVLVPAIGSKKLSLVSRADVISLKRQYQDRTYQANRAVGFLRRLYNYAEEQGDLPGGSNPTKNVKLFKEEARENLLSREEMQRIGAAIDLLSRATPQSEPAYQAILFLFLTGCRKSEALRLRWSDVDLPRESLTFRDSKNGTRHHFVDETLAGFLRSLGSARYSEWVFPGRTPYRRRVDLKRQWQAVRETAGIGRVRLHDIRHTVLTDVAAMSDIQTAAVVGGHKSIRSTMRYIHGRSEVTRQVITKAAAEKGALLMPQRDTPEQNT